MRRKLLPALLAMSALAGCTASSGVDAGPTFSAARYIPPPPQAPAVQLPPPAGRASAGLSGVAAVADANQGAFVDPTSATMNGATWAIDDASSAAIYRLPLAFGTTTVILLPAGERFTGAVGGNAQDFELKIYYAGPRPGVAVSPKLPGARGNMQLFTTGGLYSFVLQPSRRVAVNIVDLQRRAGRLAAPAITGLPQPEGDYTPLAVLPEGKAPLPAWAPVRAWADSRQMVLEFLAPLPKLPTLLAGRQGEQTVSYTSRVSGGTIYLIATPRTTYALLALGRERVRITAEDEANGTGTAWQAAEALPATLGSNVAVFVTPGQPAASAAAASPFGLGPSFPPVSVTSGTAAATTSGAPVAAPPEPPKQPVPAGEPEWM